MKLEGDVAKRALDNLVECLDPGDTALVRITRIDRHHLELEVATEGDVVIDDTALDLDLLPED